MIIFLHFYSSWGFFFSFAWLENWLCSTLNIVNGGSLHPNHVLDLSRKVFCVFSLSIIYLGMKERYFIWLKKHLPFHIKFSFFNLWSLSYVNWFPNTKLLILNVESKHSNVAFLESVVVIYIFFWKILFLIFKKIL